jgi:hypothetical protein
MKNTMNKLLALTVISVLLSSCNNNPGQEEKKTDTLTVTAVQQAPAVNYIYPSTYSSDWTIGDPQKIVKIQELYQVMLSDSNYEAILPYLADSVTNVFFDNRKARLSKTEFVEMVKKFRKGFKTLNEEFRSYVSLRSDLQNSDMVLLWLKEKGVRQNGKVDSSGYQETWRFNSQGKIDYRSTYVRYDF